MQVPIKQKITRCFSIRLFRPSATPSKGAHSRSPDAIRGSDCTAATHVPDCIRALRGCIGWMTLHPPYEVAGLANKHRIYALCMDSPLRTFLLAMYPLTVAWSRHCRCGPWPRPLLRGHGTRCLPPPLRCASIASGRTNNPIACCEAIAVDTVGARSLRSKAT